MHTIELNLATNLRGLLKFTDDHDQPRDADCQVTTAGVDPVSSATLRVAITSASSSMLAGTWFSTISRKSTCAVSQPSLPAA